MKHSLFALLVFIGCATSTTPTPTPAPAAEAAAAPPTQPPCTPGHSLVNAVLWMSSAAEYRAVALQTYANARRQLDAVLADRGIAGAEEEKNDDPSQPPAVILDLDETSLDNSEFERRMVRIGKTYDDAVWNAWVAEGAASAMPGVKEFLAYAQSRGVTPFYITNRDLDPEGPGTRANLERLGFPLVGENLLMRGAKPEWKSDKSGRRAFVAEKYRVVMLIGDDLNDFVNARDKSQAEREAIIGRTESRWGTRWFMLPNPAYGDWENAAIGSEGTPCEQMGKKIDAMR